MDKLIKSLLAFAILGSVAGCKRSVYSSKTVLEDGANYQSVLREAASTDLISSAVVDGYPTINLPIDNFFQAGTDRLYEKYEKDIKSLARLIYDRHEHKIVITSFINHDGDVRFARELALKQAKVIAAYLWLAGVPNENVTIKVSDTPIAQGDTLAARAINRRIQIKLVK